jgi:hypothetical protein
MDVGDDEDDMIDDDDQLFIHQADFANQIVGSLGREYPGGTTLLTLHPHSKEHQQKSREALKAIDELTPSYRVVCD